LFAAFATSESAGSKPRLNVLPINEVKVVFRSFELDPHAQKDADHDVHDMLALKYGMSRRQAIAMNDNVADEEEAGRLGIRGVPNKPGTNRSPNDGQWEWHTGLTIKEMFGAWLSMPSRQRKDFILSLWLRLRV
jgi:hypothetical protein